MELGLLLGPLLGVPYCSSVYQNSLLGIFATGPICALVPIFVALLQGQRVTANALAVSLSRCTDSNDFEAWKHKWYKPSLALLAVWSRKVLPLVCFGKLSLALSFFRYMHKAFVILAQWGLQPKVENDTVQYEMDSSLRETMVSYIARSLLFALLLALSMWTLTAPSRYLKQLSLVLARVAKKHDEGGKNDSFCTYDFRTLQKERGAFLVFGVALTVEQSTAWIQLLLVTSVLSLWGLSTAFPYGPSEF